MRRAYCAGIAVCMIGAVAAAPRNARVGQVSGAASLSGRVIAADTGAVVRGAMLTCGTSSGLQNIEQTDDEGRFEFRDRSLSCTTLKVGKAGFVEITLSIPARKDGQGHALGDVRLVRGAVIAGRVFDASGEPLADAIVNAWRVGYTQPGNRRLVPARSAVSTNDLGEYRLYGLPPGTYYVSASTYRGLGPEVGPTSVAYSQFVSATASPGYGVTYYPGTAYPSEAQSLNVQGGHQALGIDLRLVSGRLPALQGTVVDSQGQPRASARVRLISASVTGFVTDVSALTDASGRFTMVHPGPGEYRLGVTGSVAVANVVVAGEPVRTLNIQGAETASMVVTLGAGEQPISDLLIQTRRGNELRGRVLVDGAIPVTSAAERFMLTMNPQDAEHGGVMNAAVVATDGTFVMGGLTGRGRVLPSGAPSGASLLRVIANGLDVTDDGIDMDKGNVAGVEVHLTTRPTWVKGQLVDAEGKLIQGNIIAFSENPALWSKPNSRYVVRSSATNGIFQIVGLPAGRYLAVAVDQIGLTEWADPENLLRLRPQATPFTVVEGEAMTMSIRRR